MSRTKRDSSKMGEANRFVSPYKRQERRKMVKEFEREYIGKNQNPMIEL